MLRPTQLLTESCLLAAARAAVAQATTAVVDDRRAMFSPTRAGAPVITAQDGPNVSSGYMGMAMAPQMMAMAPGMMGIAPESAPMAEMAPGVQVRRLQVTRCSIWRKHLLQDPASELSCRILPMIVLNSRTVTWPTWPQLSTSAYGKVPSQLQDVSAAADACLSSAAFP